VLIDLARATPEQAGGKAGALGVLLRAGLPVPDGVVVPVDTADADLAGVGDAAVAALGAGAVAVRSSAPSEDAAHASAAGQLATVLGVVGPDRVAEAVRRVRASVRSDRYRAYAGRAADSATAVLVQHMVDADVAGVLFTADTGGPALVEAAHGLGEPVVSGWVIPDRFRVAAGGAVTWEPGTQQARLDRRGDRLVRSAVDPGGRTLDDAAVREVVALGERARAVLGVPLDVEWALAGGRLWLLQARPVTARLPRADGGGADGADLAGVGASGGTAVGPVRVVRGPADFGRVRPGDVLVCPWTAPAWTPLLGVVAAVVSETGGLLSHAAIVARERRVPAVVGVTGALGALADHEVVRVDGDAGTVRRVPS
jgi:pyruvate,water dikinase